MMTKILQKTKNVIKNCAHEQILYQNLTALFIRKVLKSDLYCFQRIINHPTKIVIDMDIRDNLQNIVLDYSDIEHYMKHCFRLLSNEWKCVNLQRRTENTENYIPIDWQCDFNSGYHFSSTLRYKDFAKINFPDGVDVKYPWELSRLQHLPQLGIAYIKSGYSETRYLKEFKDEVYDFNNNSPCGHGVCWGCTMDVAIRAVNLLLAYELFFSNAIVEPEFEAFFSSLIIEHGNFIVHHLEKSFINDKSGNHYLSDLTGLLFIGRFIKSDITDNWFDFAAREFIHELGKQILADGSIYECSSAYHRLSSELIAYGLAAILKKHADYIDGAIAEKVFQCMKFLSAITKPNGEIIQIGDNDNGHLIRFSSGHELESVNSISAIRALFEKGKDDLASILIDSIAGSHKLFINSEFQPEIRSRDYKEYEFSDLQYNQTTCISVPLNNVLSVSVFNEFGLIIFQCETGIVYFRFPGDFEHSNQTHMHNDMMHFEIYYNNHTYFGDQGSYIYTADIDQRNQFRSTIAHNTPWFGAEQNAFLSCWDLKKEISGGLVSFSKDKCTACMKTKNIILKRTVSIEPDQIIVEDSCNEKFMYEPKEFLYKSNGYGEKYQQDQTSGLKVSCFKSFGGKK